MGTPGKRRQKGESQSYSHLFKSTTSKDASSKRKREESPRHGPTKKLKTYAQGCSPLERLPPEILQMILFQSLSLSLPQSSAAIAYKLTDSQHLYHKFVMAKIGTIQVDDRKTRKMKMKLANCRFFDFHFYDKIMDSIRRVYDESNTNQPSRYATYLEEYQFTNFPLPRKSLHGPWTADKLSLLERLVDGHCYIYPRGDMLAVAKDGIWDAIKEESFRALSLMFSPFLGSEAYGGVERCPFFAIHPTNDMLEHAILEHTKQVGIWTFILVQSCATHRPHVNLLSAALWSFAERDKAFGPWLRTTLTFLSRWMDEPLFSDGDRYASDAAAKLHAKTVVVKVKDALAHFDGLGRYEGAEVVNTVQRQFIITSLTRIMSEMDIGKEDWQGSEVYESLHDMAFNIEHS